MKVFTQKEWVLCKSQLVPVMSTSGKLMAKIIGWAKDKTEALNILQNYYKEIDFDFEDQGLTLAGIDSSDLEVEDEDGHYSATGNQHYSLIRAYLPILKPVKFAVTFSTNSTIRVVQHPDHKDGVFNLQDAIDWAKSQLSEYEPDCRWHIKQESFDEFGPTWISVADSHETEMTAFNARKVMSALGAAGGAAKTEAKRKAAVENGKKGGRPRKSSIQK